jgi:signal transduction histidine kinase
MIAVGKLENKFAILTLSFILISLIGLVDYLSSAELTLSFFYLIPISLHALYKGTAKLMVIFNSVFACLIWTLVIIDANFYSNIFYTVWNSLIILAFFLTTGLLLYALKTKYKEIQELLKYLSELNEEKNKFIGIAAHDLRNPISSIYSFSEILLSKLDRQFSPDLVKIVLFIKEISSDSLIMLGNLLSISAIESGKMKITYKLQDYIEFIKKYIYLNQIIANQKDIQIKLETTENQIPLNFDEHYLSEVINNLLANAIKFSNPQSEIIVKVSMTLKKTILTEVIDKGQGIPKEEHIKLFNYFQKASTLPTHGEKSTGLGLAIAKKVILEHNGKISLKSDLGNGSNFYYELN